MQRAQRGRSSPSLGRRHQRLATVGQAGHQLFALGHRQERRLPRCAIMGHEKGFLSVYKNTFQEFSFFFFGLATPPLFCWSQCLSSTFLGVGGCAVPVQRLTPSCTSHTRIVRSALLLASRLPSRCQAMPLTRFVCPRKMRRHAPVRMSHTRTV